MTAVILSAATHPDAFKDGTKVRFNRPGANPVLMNGTFERLDGARAVVRVIDSDREIRMRPFASRTWTV